MRMIAQLITERLNLPCGVKTGRWINESDAKRMARTLRRHHYRCQHCECWHISRLTPEQAELTRRPEAAC